MKIQLLSVAIGKEQEPLRAIIFSLEDSSASPTDLLHTRSEPDLFDTTTRRKNEYHLARINSAQLKQMRASNERRVTVPEQPSNRSTAEGA